MPRQVHRIMQHAQDVDDLSLIIVPDSEHDEMTSSSAMAGDMQRE